MVRAVLKIAIVAAICSAVVHFRDAQGDSVPAERSQQIDWVRTVDGWEPAAVLTLGPPPPAPPKLHPAAVATLQLGISVFALLALPPAVRVQRKS